MEVFKLLGTIALDNSGAMSGMDDTVTKAKKTESNLSKIFKKVGTIVVSAFAVDKIKEFGNACKDAYAEVAAEQSAFAQIMGDYAGEAQDKLDEIAAKTGTVSTRMTPYMTSLTAKFKGLGYGIDEATDLASTGLNMAADAAAFWDMSLDESMSHLNSFINGSYEGGEAIGLFANDTQMAAYAIEKGLVQTTAAWSALDEATKQATRLEYAENMMAMSGATGQAAKESKSLANVQANLTEHWRQFLAVIGEPIVNNLVIPAMEKLNEIMPKVTEATKKGIEWIGNAFSTVKESMQNLPQLMSSAGETISDAWTNKIYPSIRDAFKIAFGIELPEWSELKSTVKNWWEGDNGIKRGIASVCNWVLNLFGAPANVTSQDVSEVLSSWWTSAKSLVQNACNWVLQLFGAPKKLTASDADDIIDPWWKSARSHVEESCTWLLKQFGAPEDMTSSKVKEVLDTWWASTKTHVEDACLWGLKQFGAPEDVSADEAKRILSGWWTSTKAHVISACDWVLQVFKNPETLTAEKVKTILKTWWENAKGFVQSACAWALNIFGEPGEATQLDVENILKPWWLKAVELVKGICTWALNFFSAPDDMTTSDAEDILDTWWGKALKLVQDTCSWVLSLFGAPSELTETDVENIIGSWWTNAVTLVEKACAWVLNLFGEPEALSADKVEEILGNWWTGAKALVQNACAWVLQLFTNPNEDEEKILKRINSWWETVGNVVAGACSWVLQLFGVPEEKADKIQSIIQTWWEGIKDTLVGICGVFFSILGGSAEDAKKIVTDWWENTKENCNNICKALFGIELPDPSQIITNIQNWWEGIKSSLGLSASATVHTSPSGTGHGGGGSSFSGSGSTSSLSSGFTGGYDSGGMFDRAWWDEIPGFATGLDYVPRDNFLARLHQGEAVLTRDEADVWRGNGDTSRMESVLNNVANLLQVIAQNTGAGTQVVLDSGVLVGQLAPGLDAQLGTISSRKGRRN